jgi:hypothetical protein
MPTNETLRTATRDPTGFIDRKYLDQIIDRIQDALTDPTPPALAAALHRFVYTRVEYDDDLGAGLNRSPQETVRLDGRCADQALLLYALYSEAEFEARITALEEIDGMGQHALVEVGFPAPPNRIIDQLGSFYRDHDIVTAGTYRYFSASAEAMVFFVADPTSSRYIGDDTGLKEMGYVAAGGTVRIDRRFQLWGTHKNASPAGDGDISVDEGDVSEGPDAHQ